MKHKTIWAGIPKKLVRKSDGMDFGPEITLGYTHYIGGEKLDEPLWELEEHYERVEIPLADLRLGMVFKTEDGKPYTITAFTEDRHPIYGEGELEVEIPEGYWEQFEPQPTEEEEVEYMTQEELDESVSIGDEITIDNGKVMRCVDIVDGVPQWEMV